MQATGKKTGTAASGRNAPYGRWLLKMKETDLRQKKLSFLKKAARP